MLVQPSLNVRSSSTTRIRMVGFASGGMESASNAPREARVSDIPEERGTRPCVTGSASSGRIPASFTRLSAATEGCSLFATRCGAPASRPVNVRTAKDRRKRLKTDDFTVVTDSTAGSRMTSRESYYVGVAEHRWVRRCRGNRLGATVVSAWEAPNRGRLPPCVGWQP